MKQFDEAVRAAHEVIAARAAYDEFARTQPWKIEDGKVTYPPTDDSAQNGRVHQAYARFYAIVTPSFIVRLCERFG